MISTTSSRCFAIANHVSRTVIDEVEPWIENPVIPDFDSKEKFRAWCASPTTRHVFFNFTEAENPALRAGPDNPPMRIHGLIADFDAYDLTDADIERGLARASSEYPLFAWNRTFSGGVRVVWVFEAPVFAISKVVLKALYAKAKRELRVRDMFPGLDDQAWEDPFKTYTSGSGWKVVGGIIQSAALELWMMEASAKENWADRGRAQPPLEEVAAKLAEKYGPHFWPTEFRLGSRGTRFWDGGDTMSVIVREGGLQAHTGDRPFIPWDDAALCGREFINRYLENRLGGAIRDLFYDGRHFWRCLPGDRWQPMDTDSTRRHLMVRYGLKSTPPKGEEISEIQTVMHRIETSKWVKAALPFPCNPNTIVTFNGAPHLNISSIRIVLPSLDDCDWGEGFSFIASYLSRFFKTEEGMIRTLAWLKHAYKGCHEGDPTRGQALFIVGPPGCIAGDTTLTYRRGTRNSGRPIKLAELFRKFRGEKTHSRGWDLSKDTFLQSFDVSTGRIFWNRVVSVVDSGVKNVVRLTTKGGREVILTAKHPVMTADRGFVPAGDLRPGDALVIRGTMRPQAGAVSLGRKPRVVVEALKFYSSGWEQRVGPYVYKRQHRARLVIEAQLNGMSYDAFINALKTDPQAENLKVLPRDVDVHHIDEDPTNDAIYNLKVYKREAHNRLHGDVGAFNVQYTDSDEVVSVEAAGMTHTFDIQMALPGNNFVLENSLIVHNTGKTLFSHAFLGRIFGGAADASMFLVDGEKFNDALFENFIWQINDSMAATNAGAHARFTTGVKAVVANPTFRYQRKYGANTDIPFFGRLIVTMNDDAASLEMLPNLDASIRDKLILVRTTEEEVDLPCRGADLDRLIDSELPSFLNWLLRWTPPADIVGPLSRFGYAAHLEEDLQEEAQESSATGSIVELVDIFADTLKRSNPDRTEWWGTSTQLHAALMELPETKHSTPRNPIIMGRLIRQAIAQGFQRLRRESKGGPGTTSRWGYAVQL